MRGVNGNTAIIIGRAFKNNYAKHNMKSDNAAVCVFPIRFSDSCVPAVKTPLPERLMESAVDNYN